MAIQNRRGAYVDLNPAKAVPGELLVVQSGDPNTTDGKAVYITFASGDVKLLATKSDVETIVAGAVEDIVQDLEDTVDGYADRAETAASNAEDIVAGAEAAIEAKGEEVVNSIPSDYTALTAEVGDIKSALPHKVDQRATPYGYVTWLYDQSIWQGGGINPENGENNSPISTIGKARIRTTTFVIGIERILCINGEQNVHIFKYNPDGTYNSYEGSFADFSSFDYENYKYRIALVRVSGDTIVNTLPKYVMLANKSNLATATDVAVLDSILSLDGNILLDYAIADIGRYIRFSTGAAAANSSMNTTGYIDISLYSELLYKQIASTAAAPTCGMAFYDVNKTYISGQRCSTGASEFGYISDLKAIRVPTNAVYARFTTIKDTDTYGLFVAYGKSKLYKAIGEYSNFQKDIYWGQYSSEWYKAQGDSYEGFTINTLCSEMVTAWDALVSGSNGYITKDTIGTSSNNQTMYCYKLIPAVYRNGTGTGSPGSKAPIILIVPSQHGFEKSAAFGTYYFARDLVYNYDKNPVLNSIRTKCILYIVPVANPYGFDNKTRKNANGVDLNRNWGTPDGSSGGGSTDPDSPYYAGEEPFDQPETQAIKAIIDATPNMFYVIDYHTNGQYNASSWANVNWISYPHQVVDDIYFNNAYIAGYFQCSDLSENLLIEYDLDTNGATIGSMTVGAAPSVPGVGGVTIGAYARTQNIMGQTFEGNNGLPSEDGSYSAMEQKINSELIGNWVKNLLLAFSKVI